MAPRLGHAVGTSICEHRPADVVAPDLIFEHEVPDFVWQLVSLPLALDPAGSSVVRIGRLRGLDRVGGSAEVVLGQVSYAGGLACGVGREAHGSSKWARGGHGMTTHRSGLHHPHLTLGPRSGGLDGLTRARVSWAFFFEVTKHVLGTVGGPEREQSVMCVGERPTATDRDQALVTNGGQDHSTSMPVLHSAAGRHLRPTTWATWATWVHARDVSVEGLDDLHRERADVSRGAVDQHRPADRKL